MAPRDPSPSIGWSPAIVMSVFPLKLHLVVQYRRPGLFTSRRRIDAHGAGLRNTATSGATRGDTSPGVILFPEESAQHCRSPGVRRPWPSARTTRPTTRPPASVSGCAARNHQSRLQPHHLQHGRWPPWPGRRNGLVDHKHDPGAWLFCLHLSQVPGQGQT